MRVGDTILSVADRVGPARSEGEQPTSNSEAIRAGKRLRFICTIFHVKDAALEPSPLGQSRLQERLVRWSSPKETHAGSAAG